MASSIPILLFLSVPLTLLSTLSTCSENFAWNHSPSGVYAPNCDFHHSDIGKALVQGKHCTEACRRFPGCTHFAWTRDGGGTCFFKHKAGITTASAVPNSSAGSVCGILKGSSEFAWKHYPSVVYAPNCDFRSSDVGSKRVPGKDCATACRRFPRCTHFAWTRDGGGTCFFKHKAGITTASAIPNSSPGSVCGILKAP